MNPSTPDIRHLKSQTIGAFVDAELPPPERLTVEQHLSECLDCALRVISTQQLKRSINQAGQRFAPTPEFRSRIQAQLNSSARAEGKSPRPKISTRIFAWSAIAAALLLGISFLVWNQYRRNDVLAAELLDQHLATLSSGAIPQITSSDKHTVKPWFQGRIPFSFNLPEAGDLPPDTVLNGADLAYVRGQPAALLLFTIRKHQVSVLLMQRSAEAAWMNLPSARSGFSIRSATAPDLFIVGVSNVNQEELDRLIAVLAKAQSPG